MGRATITTDKLLDATFDIARYCGGRYGVANAVKFAMAELFDPELLKERGKSFSRSYISSEIHDRIVAGESIYDIAKDLDGEKSRELKPEELGFSNEPNLPTMDKKDNDQATPSPKKPEVKKVIQPIATVSGKKEKPKDEVVEEDESKSKTKDNTGGMFKTFNSDLRGAIEENK